MENHTEETSQLKGSEKKKPLIYSVEDDLDIAEIIVLTLQKKGYDVLSFQDGESFLEAFKKRKPDLVLLDLMLPGIQGNEIIASLRGNEDNNPIEIIVVSAKHLIKDKVAALDLGADDYLEKPFDLSELVSRVNAHLRHKKEEGETLRFGDLLLNKTEKLFFVKGKSVDLTKNEFAIMTALLESPNRPISRESLALSLYQDVSRADGKSIDMHIRSLRNKLLMQGEDVLVSVYGSGYKLVANE